MMVHFFHHHLFYIFLTNFVLFFQNFFIYLEKKYYMGQNKNVNLFLRFIKDENLYTTVSNSLKFYFKLQKKPYDFYQQIVHASCNGTDPYNFFEWIFRLKFLENNELDGKRMKISDKIGNDYSIKWKQYLENNHFEIK